MLNKNTILLRVWTLAPEPYAKHYEATQEHHMILNWGGILWKGTQARIRGDIKFSHSIQ